MCTQEAEKYVGAEMRNIFWHCTFLTTKPSVIPGGGQVAALGLAIWGNTLVKGLFSSVYQLNYI